MRKGIIIVIICSLVMNLGFLLPVDAIDAEDYGCESICGTDSELIQELQNELLQQRITEANVVYALDNDGIRTNQIVIGTPIAPLMPSKGDIKVLVLPIEFSDCKFDREHTKEQLDYYFCRKLNSFTNDGSINNPGVPLSVPAFYESRSYGKLRLSSTVLPFYTATEDWNYYKENNYSLLNVEITEALKSYASIIGGLSEYDSNDDGYIDCLIVQLSTVIDKAVVNGIVGDVGGQINYGNDLRIYNDIKIGAYVVLSDGHTNCTDHEIGHLLGLPDNYPNSPCNIPYGCNELMTNLYMRRCVNAYYRWLLGWEDPLILPYEEALYDDDSVNLYASDVYFEDSTDKTRSIIFVPEGKNNAVRDELPFGELYIAEYRAFGDPPHKVDGGIIIWHVKLKTLYDGSGEETKDYIVPVYKSGVSADKFIRPDYTNQDTYTTGDIWSADTTPSSNFYNNRYTGAYLEVIGTDEEKASIQAGYKDPDTSPAPVVMLSPATKSYVNSTQEVRWYYSVDDYDPEETVWAKYSVITTGTVTLNSTYNPFGAEKYIAIRNAKGDGTVQLEIKPGMAGKGWNLSDGFYGDVITVDNTPPVIVLNGDSLITIEKGDAYIEFGASVHDNLDPQIADSLVIDNSAVNTNEIGKYKVCYNAQDQAGNTAIEVVRLVNVVEPRQYRVSLFSNGGELTNIFTSYTHGVETVLPIPIRTGYIFDGWYDNADLRGSAITHILKTDTGDKTYYAKWKACNHSERVEETIFVPTCTSEGKKNTTCKLCKAVWVDTIAKLPHTEVIDLAVEPSCETFGKTAGSHCSICGEIITVQTEIPALGHDFTGTYLTDETGHWHKCSRCDAVDTKVAHSYNTANCGEAANCTVCGYTKAAGTHAWNAGEVITAPTCTTTGTMKYTCTSCGETKKETIPVSSHTPGDTWASDGAGHWHNCTVCNQKVDSVAHTFGSWTTTKAETATTAGSRERACTVCGYKQTETIPATGGGSSSGGSIGGGGGGLVIAPPAEDKKDEEQTSNTAVYNDVPANAWYNDAVSFVTEKGLMSGVGTNTFAPGANLTRAMLAQILYNNEDKPTTSGTAFTDVQSGAWYADAITWATQKGIVSGYGNGLFGPDDNITREQLVAILWRYAGQPASNASLNDFTDIDKASDYALAALQWAVEKGIISGKGNGTLDPTGNATRAEVAQMLMNLPPKFLILSKQTNKLC